MCLTHIGGLQGTISAHPPLLGHKCTCWRGHCGGPIPRVHPQVLPCIYPRGIIPGRPRVASFITARTIFKAFGDILSGPFVPLSRPYPLGDLKSSLICETLANWRQIDRWDASHPPVYFSRQTRQVLSHQQDWKDNKLCHDAPSDTAPKRPTDVMIALSVLCNHHYKGQLSTIEIFSTFEHYKSPTEIEQRGDTMSSLTLSLSLSLRVSIHSQSLTWASEGVSRQPVWASLCREVESPDFVTGTGTFTTTSKGGIHPQLTWYQHSCITLNHKRLLAFFCACKLVFGFKGPWTLIDI